MKPSSSNAKDVGIVAQYAPSSLDRFMLAVQRLPTPYWLTYLFLFILQGLLIHVLAWIDRWISPFTFSLMLLLFPLWLWAPMAIMTHLNLTAHAAMPSFARLLRLDKQGVEQLRHEFTTMPSRGVLLSSVLWFIVYLLLTILTFTTLYSGLGLTGWFALLIFLEGLVSYSLGSAMYYHSVRQLWLVDRTVRKVKRFNLFELGPVYAFAGLTARTGISWMFMLATTLLVFPLVLAMASAIPVLVVQALLAVAAFVLPLQAVNQQLVLEKRRRLGEVHRRLDAIIERLHLGVDKNKMEDAGRLSSIVMGLRAERDVLKDISTLPWRAGTLTGFLSATLLSIVSVLIQIAVRSLLGGG
jgi:hypothetical protein